MSEPIYRPRRAPDVRWYDFHGLCRVLLVADDQRALDYFDVEYGRFATRAGGTPDVEIRFGPFELPGGRSARGFGHCIVMDGWVSGAERHKVAAWRFALRGLEEATTQLLFDGGHFGPYFLQGFYLEHVMRYRLAGRGGTMVHGGCLARGGVSVLFPGLAHAGKTALALYQAHAGWAYQTDEFAFFTTAGETFSYPRRVHINGRTLASIPAAGRGLSQWHRASLAGKRAVQVLTLGYGNLEEAVGLGELLPAAVIADRARLGAVLLLATAPGRGVRGPTRLAPEEVVERIATVNRLEGRRFQVVVAAGAYYGLWSSIADWWTRERAVLAEGLGGAPGYELVVSRAPANPAAQTAAVARAMDGLLAAARVVPGSGTAQHPPAVPAGQTGAAV